MNPLVLVIRETQDALDDFVEPASDAPLGDHLRYIGAFLLRRLMSWKGLAVVAAVEAVAIAIEVIW